MDYFNTIINFTTLSDDIVPSEGSIFTSEVKTSFTVYETEVIFPKVSVHSVCSHSFQFNIAINFTAEHLRSSWTTFFLSAKLLRSVVSSLEMIFSGKPCLG